MFAKMSTGLLGLAAVFLVAVAIVSMGGSRTELESSLMQQEVAGCMQLAKEFKGTKAGQRKVTMSQKIEAMRCAQLIKMAHGGAAHKAAGTTQSLKYIDDENGPEARKPVWAPGRGYIKQPASNPHHYVDFPSSSNQATTSGLNQNGKETCNCCAFAGCPCCQPAMHAPVTQLASHATKKPFFHREGKWAKKHTQKLQMKKRVPMPPHGKKVNAISWDIGYVAAHSKAMPMGFKF